MPLVSAREVLHVRNNIQRIRDFKRFRPPGEHVSDYPLRHVVPYVETMRVITLHSVWLIREPDGHIAVVRRKTMGCYRGVWNKYVDHFTNIHYGRHAMNVPREYIGYRHSPLHAEMTMPWLHEPDAVREVWDGNALVPDVSDDEYEEDESDAEARRYIAELRPIRKVYIPVYTKMIHVGELFDGREATYDDQHWAEVENVGFSNNLEHGIEDDRASNITTMRSKYNHWPYRKMDIKHIMDFKF